ncbi:hypothetical protein FGO68_gene16168 [Halteria grandinella]|uniref:PAS domain-containing protein n=1 Tax=Halteria grandinella TaxID=5974 RepID=A0A8J8TAR1_HALGN|nr:hypothetical protein FGO68_gene16168 [Halteria grandinella]
MGDQEASDGEEGDTVYQDFQNKVRQEFSVSGHSISGQKSTEVINKNFNTKFLTRSYRVLVGRLFKINHVLLSEQTITPFIFYIFIIFEFLQVAYYTFYKVDILNEFKNSISTVDADSLLQTMNNVSYSGTNTYQNGSQATLTDQQIQTAYSLGLIDQITDSLTPTTYRLDESLLFVNFHLYPLVSHSFTEYFEVYLIFNISFIALVVFMFCMAENLYRRILMEEVKDTAKLMIRVASSLLGVFIFVLQILMVTINLQGYLCDEDAENIMILFDNECGSTQNQLLIVSSTFFLTIYLIFLLVHSKVYTASTFTYSIPWAAIDSDVTFFTILWKLIISFGYIFDKYGSHREELDLVCFLLGFYISIKRAFFGITFHRGLHYARGTQLFLLSWLQLVVGAHTYFGKPLTTTDILISTTTGLFLGLVLVIVGEWWNSKLIKSQMYYSNNLKEKRPSLVVSLGLISKLLIRAENDKMEDSTLFKGLILQHIDGCIDNDASCPYCEYFTQKITSLSASDLQEAFDEITTFKTKRSIVSWNNLPSSYISDKFKHLRSAISKSSLKFFTGRDPVKHRDQSTSPHLSHREMIGESFDFVTSSEISKPQYQRAGIVQDEEPPGHPAQIIFNPKAQEEQYKLKRTQNRQPLSKPADLLSKISSIEKLQSELTVTSPRFVANNVSEGAKDAFVLPHLHSITDINTNFTDILGKKANLDVGGIDPNQGPIHTARKVVDERKSIGGKAESMRIKRSLQGTFISNEPEFDQVYKEDQKYEILDESEVQKIWVTLKYKFVQFYIEKLIRLFPQSSTLRIHSSQILLSKLENEFKANFELMQCELCSPSLQSQFFIFRRRIELDQVLMVRNERDQKKGNKVDPIIVYKYEKLYNKFQRIQYFAANSALNFWRELMQRTIDTHVLLTKGSEISRYYEQMQQVVKQLLEIFPDNISFVIEYALVLKQIVNNQQEAIMQLDKAYNIYNLKINSNRQNENKDAKSEEDIFMNSKASGVVIASLEAREVGIILHVNQELERILGHKRTALIGTKINNLQPQPIAKVHDRILRRFLDTAKRRVSNHTLQLYALTNEGYMRPINIIVKLYPFMSEKITIVGFINSLNRLDGFDLQSLGLQSTLRSENSQHHYIITDEEGFISCLTKGLSDTIGLSQAFLTHFDDLQSRPTIQQLIKSNFDGPLNEHPDLLSHTGLDCEFDTEQILNTTNNERISSEELLKAKQCCRLHRANVMMKRMVFDEEFCTIHLYRVIMYNSNQGINENSGANTEQKLSNLEVQEGSENSATADKGFSMSSTSSGISSNGSKTLYTKMIQEFKNTMGKRNVPSSLKKLSWMIIIIIFLTIIISSVGYGIQLQYISQASQLTYMTVLNESRSVVLIELLIYIRSLLNIASGGEPTVYHGPSLKRIDRFEHLQQAIQLHTDQLQYIADTMSQRRTDFQSDLQSEFELRAVMLYRITDGSLVDTYENQYKIAFNTFLNKIPILESVSQESLTINQQILNGNPMNITLKKDLRDIDKDLFYIVANGLRSLRQTTGDASSFKLANVLSFSQTHDKVPFITIMIVGVLVSAGSLAVIVHQILINQRNKEQIMTIFALISNQQIKAVYDVCDAFIDRFHQQTSIYDDEEYPDEAKQSQQVGSKQQMARSQMLMTECEKLAGKSQQEIEDEKSKKRRMTVNQMQSLKNCGLSSKDYYLKKIVWCSKFFAPEPLQPTNQELQQNQAKPKEQLNTKNDALESKELKLSKRNDQHDKKYSKHKLYKEFGLDESAVNQSQIGLSNANDETVLEEAKEHEEFDSSLSEKSNKQTNKKIEKDRKKKYKGDKSTEERRLSLFSLPNTAINFISATADPNSLEILHRQDMLRNSPRQKRKCLNLIFANLAVFLVFIAYFIFLFLYHASQLSILRSMIEISPKFSS